MIPFSSQVTFCKRKGGLFKKADDLSKLCGVEVAVVILQDKGKTTEYASTDVNRILEQYKERQAGQTEDMSETAKLWEKLEQQRRDIEALTRELAAEKRQVEELRGSHMLGAAVLEAETLAGGALPPMSMPPMSMPMTSSLPSLLPTSDITKLMQDSGTLLPPFNASSFEGPESSNKLWEKLNKPEEISAPESTNKDDVSEASEDTAEVDSGNEGVIVEEPSAKRIRLDESIGSKIQESVMPIISAAPPVVNATQAPLAVE